MDKEKIRERLVELVKRAIIDWEHGDVSERIADHLLAHGVTVQRWISVKDRLPEPFVPVLVQMPGEAPHPTVREGFISKDGIWYSALYHREPDEITHWQPLPESPKEET